MCQAAAWPEFAPGWDKIMRVVVVVLSFLAEPSFWPWRGARTRGQPWLHLRRSGEGNRLRRMRGNVGLRPADEHLMAFRTANLATVVIFRRLKQAAAMRTRNAVGHWISPAGSR